MTRTLTPSAESPTDVDDVARLLTETRARLADPLLDPYVADVTADGLLGDRAGGVDLIVANPPYIPDGAELEPEVAQHDPHHALFGGADGMAVIEPIVAHATRLLRPGTGRIGLEHDDTTAAATVAVFDRAAAFTKVVAHLDLTRRPRFVTATRRE